MKVMMCLLRFVSLVTRKTLFNFWPHHFRERSDLSCFQLNLPLNQSVGLFFGGKRILVALPTRRIVTLP